MIATTRTAAAALVLTFVFGATPALLATESPDSATYSPAPLRDDSLSHAFLDIFPHFEPEPAPEPEPDTEAIDPATYGDPYGFNAIINNYRASAGLPPVSYDPNLSAWASQNNAAQCSMGLGHHVLQGFFQNCGYNQASVLDIAHSWMASPGHAQNMLTPSASRFGIAYGPGPYWTLNMQ